MVQVAVTEAVAWTATIRVVRIVRIIGVVRGVTVRIAIVRSVITAGSIARTLVVSVVIA